MHEKSECAPTLFYASARRAAGSAPSLGVRSLAQPPTQRRAPSANEMAASNSAAPPPPPQQRRLHLAVGEHAFLPALLRVHHGDWLGEPQMHELMALLHAAVPETLPNLLQQRSTSRVHAQAIEADTLCARLTFLPTTSSCWLLCDGDEQQQQQQQHAPATTTTMSAVPYTLLVDVEPRAAAT